MPELRFRHRHYLATSRVPIPSLFRFLPLVPPSFVPVRPSGAASLFPTYKVPFDRPRSIKDGQISLYRLATSILESVFNGADPPPPPPPLPSPRRRRDVFRVSSSANVFDALPRLLLIL